MTKAQCAKRALVIWLGGFSIEAVMDHIFDIKETWYRSDSKPDLTHCAPLALMAGVLLSKTTGVHVLTEDTAHRWILECEKIILAEPWSDS